MTVGALGAGLVAVAAALTHVVWQLWPAVEAIAAQAPAAGAADVAATVPPVRLFGVRLEPSVGQAHLALILAFGAVGSYIHAVTSFTTFVGNRQFRLSWMWWYLLRPFVGAAVALVLVVAGLGGLLTLSAGGTAVDPRSFNPYAIAALAGLAGWFSKTAADKLEEIFETVLANAKDGARADKLVDDGPVIDTVTITPSVAGARVALAGSGFTNESVVRIDGVVHDTSVDGFAGLVVDLTLDDLPAGVAEIVVANPTERASTPIAVRLPGAE